MKIAIGAAFFAFAFGSAIGQMLREAWGLMP